MKYLSVCSGIEAASVAWHPVGWTPVAFAEIEPFPSAVLAHRFPHVPNLGDMSKFSEWPDAAFDLLVGGTPCQSFSVAGLRAGLADPRGNLALVYLAIADRYRPRYVLWENVPGVLSSNGGRDFGAFLGALGQLGYGFAYRVLDAQYVRIDGFGRAVPQRRRRVFVVGCLGGWRRAGAVLFDAASLHGDSAPRREARQGVAPTLAARTRGGGGLGTDFDCDGGLVYQDVAHCLTRGANQRLDYETESFVAHTLKAGGFDASKDGTGRGTPLVPVVSDTLTSNGDAHSGFRDHRGLVPSLDQQWAVRRLTPTECERLQGFPDSWTDIPWRGKPAADGPRYKALGNSMACNVMRWIGRRIERVEQIAAELRDCA